MTPSSSAAAAAYASPAVIVPSIGPSVIAEQRRLPPRVVVSQRAFVCCWFVILSLHVLCLLVAGLLGGLHAFTAIPENYVYSKTSHQIPRAFLVMGARAFAVIASLHALAIVRVLRNSLRFRELCFRAEQIRGTRPGMAPAKSRSLGVLTPFRWLNAQWERLFGIDGRFGLNGPHFETAFHLRKTTEILSQTYQAYYLSVLLANRFINTLAVGVILTACFTAPVLRRAFPGKSRAFRRYLWVVLDLVVDMSHSAVVPLYTLYSSMKDFDWATSEFPIALVYDKVWFARQTAMGRFLLVWSTTDLVSTTILQLSLLGSLLVAARCLRREHPTPPGAGASSSSSVTATGAKRRTRAFTAPSSELIPVASPASALCGRWSSWLSDAVFVAWGLAVLVAHIMAQFNSAVSLPPCKLVMYAWGTTTRPACSVVEINCHREHIAGHAHEVAPLLDAFDRRTLTTLLVVHCPLWTMPPELLAFGQLQSVTLYNVTLNAWDATAAVTQRQTPWLSHVFLAGVRLRAVPEALLHAELPRSLINLELSRTNLSALPESIGTFWRHPWMRINIEHSQLTALPASFWRLNVSRVSLTNNRIERLPDDALATLSLQALRLSRNPLRALPPVLGDMRTLRRLALEDTQLSDVPPWIETWWRSQAAAKRKVAVSLRGSPACASWNVSLQTELQDAFCTHELGDADGVVPWNVLERLFPL
ncbi:hypothetical protein PINS_up008310 [Pythium insidiosum]|nr:hypothetical protein PINS_up008310 [Pythium insidiosum]